MNVPISPPTRAGLDPPRTEASHTAEPSRADETPEGSTPLSGVEACSRCGGSGVIPVPGMSLNPFSGERGWDPQNDDDFECPRCDGDGTLGKAA